MKKLQYIIFILIFISCRKVIVLDLPVQKQTLVLNSNLTLDSFISINLALTQGITENAPNYSINNAFISLYDKDSNFIENLQNGGNGLYFSNTLKGIPNKLYIAKIINQNTTYYTSDSIPNKSVAFIIDTARIIFQGKANYFNIDYKITDNQKQTNFYGLKLKRKYIQYFTINNILDSIAKEEWINIDTRDFILTENEISQFSKKHILFNDRFFSQATRTIKFGNANILSSINQKTMALIINLEQYSPQAFNYYQTLNEHLFYQNDPFSQPSTVKGNMPNGYGAFVGKSIKADTIKFY